MYWTIKRIADWNKKTFPNSTPAMQKRKLASEVIEYYQKGADKLEELADVYIAAASAYKLHGDAISRLLCELIEDKQAVMEEVDRKMNINKKRSWTLFRGNWRHVDSF